MNGVGEKKIGERATLQENKNKPNRIKQDMGKKKELRREEEWPERPEKIKIEEEMK